MTPTCPACAKRMPILETALEVLIQERCMRLQVCQDNGKLIDKVREQDDVIARLRWQLIDRDATIAQLRASIDPLKREYLIPPYHDTTADDFLKSWGEAEGHD